MKLLRSIPLGILLLFVGKICFHPHQAVCLSIEDAPEINIIRSALYTNVQIRLVPINGREEALQAAESAFNVMEKAASLINMYDSSSVISAFNKKRSIFASHSEEEKSLVQILQRVKKMIDQTEKAYNPLAGPLIRYWEEVRGGQRMIDRTGIDSILSLCDPQLLQVHTAEAHIEGSSATIHLGGVIKGYAVDCGVAYLQSLGYHDFLINAGGDLYASGKKKSGDPWRIGIQHPREISVYARFSVSDRAIATSGDYESFFIINGERYHHIIDPRTGFPSKGAISATAAAKDAFTADAWATAAVVLGPRSIELLEQHNRENEKEKIDVLMIMEDGTVLSTDGFPVDSKDKISFQPPPPVND